MKEVKMEYKDILYATSQKIIQDLYEKLFNCNNINLCPNGNPIMVHLKLNEIEKYF